MKIIKKLALKILKINEDQLKFAKRLDNINKYEKKLNITDEELELLGYIKHSNVYFDDVRKLHTLKEFVDFDLKKSEVIFKDANLSVSFDGYEVRPELSENCFRYKGVLPVYKSENSLTYIDVSHYVYQLDTVNGEVVVFDGENYQKCNVEFHEILENEYQSLMPMILSSDDNAILVNPETNTLQ